MQTIVQVVCSRGKSLRDLIVNDSKLSRFKLAVYKKQQPGRPRGWAKVYGTAPERHGALNVQWHADTRIMVCRVINRGAGRPGLILGDFIAYLFSRHHHRIKSVNIIPN
jgi:hypothetical protein